MNKTDTPADSYTPCAWMWASRPLPELGDQVRAALESAGLPVVSASAEAFGENCVDPQTNEVIDFAVMETDFRIAVQVENLEDREALGNLLEQILIVLDGFPPESTPGPQPGYVGVTFQANGDELNLWFEATAAQAARSAGLHGAVLLENLMNR